jgi:tetratricopeptide (TPR) repeat protein
MDNPAWHESGLAAALPGPERATLRHHVGELLWWWARALSWEADGRPAAERQATIAEALRLNERAVDCYGEGEAPGAVWRQRAGLLRRAGREGEAAQVSKRAEEATAPRSPREHYLSLGEMADAGRWRQALPVLQEAARHDARSAALWLIFGHAYAAGGQPHEASACYDLALSLDPEFPWGWFHRGLLRLRTGRHDQARADFDRVLELRPDLVEALMNRALAHLGSNDLPAAEADLTAALELGAPYTRIHFMRARVRAQAGNHAGAQADIAEGLRREPADEQSWVARGVARLPRDPAGALADFDRALALNPRSLSALQNKAHVLSEHGKGTEEAVRLLDDAIRFHPDAGPARAGRGVLLARLAKRSAALSDARAALARDRDPRIVYQVAGIYALTARTHPGDRAEALRLLREAFRQDARLLELSARDTDLDPVRDHPDFKEVLRSARVLHRAP